ncbi:MAG: substrate-binding domain-containing protein [Candidatus Rokubacteria bacterium]|nr:substrate-binding domain-containing protein [Candidatus Rokubacteria bacterium]
MTRRRLVLILALAVAGLAARGGAESKVVILATTTSLQDSGLLDVLVPMFERQTGLTVKTVAVGTGQALALAARGEADVTLAHAPELEKKYLRNGKMLNRRLVMVNDFVIVGPPRDPAQIRGLTQAVDAVRRIAAARARFVSRGDHSGTHQRELALWKEAGITPGPWYIESGRGMGATLMIADERLAYTLTDRGTLLAQGRRLGLEIVVEGDPRLRNVYAVLEVSPANGPRVNAAGGKAFADFVVSREAQAVIRTFGVEKYGQPLFVPMAGRRDDEVGG